jgi:multidrug efflux pump subunit AcrB
VNGGKFYIQLKPRNERPHVTEVIVELRHQVAAVRGINVFFQPVQNLNIGVPIALERSDLQIKSPQAVVNVDRQKAAALGLTAEQIRNTLTFGSRQVATISTASNDYAVILEVDPFILAHHHRFRAAGRRHRCAVDVDALQHESERDSMDAIMGGLPIALGFGAGAELRQPLGLAVVGGLLTSQLLTSTSLL